MPDRLTADRIRPHLEARWIGSDLRCLDEVDSTNTVARDLARAGAPQGTVVIADAQRSGRGRLGRSWVSPPGRNLYVSIVLRPNVAAAQLAPLGLVAGVAICDAIREWAPAAVIKWPNDILVGWRKVSGILTEMETFLDSCFVIAGIGVNLNIELDEFPAELRDKAGSLWSATGQRIDRARFAGRLLVHLERRYDTWRQQGFAPLAALWQERSCLTGRQIVVEAPDGRFAGEVLGLDETGALRLELASGQEHRIVAGDVTVLGVLSSGA